MSNMQKCRSAAASGKVMMDCAGEVRQGIKTQESREEVKDENEQCVTNDALARHGLHDCLPIKEEDYDAERVKEEEDDAELAQDECASEADEETPLSYTRRRLRLIKEEENPLHAADSGSSQCHYKNPYTNPGAGKPSTKRTWNRNVAGYTSHMQRLEKEVERSMLSSGQMRPDISRPSRGPYGGLRPP